MNKGALIVVVAILGALAIWAFSHYAGVALDTEMEALAAIEDPAERIDAVIAFAEKHPDLDMGLFEYGAAVIAEAAHEIGEFRAVGYVDTVLMRPMPENLWLPLTAQLHDLIMMHLYCGLDDELVEKADAIAARLLESDELSGNTLAFCANMRDGITRGVAGQWPVRVPDPWLTLALAEKGHATGDEIERWHRGALGGAYGAIVTVAGLRRGEDVKLAMIDSLLAVAPDTRHKYFLNQRRFDETIGVDDAAAVESAREMAKLMDERGEMRSLNTVGYALAENDLAPGLAVALCERAFELAETVRESAYVLDSVGWAHHKAGNQVEAARALEKSLAIGRSSPAYGQVGVSHLLAVYDASADTEAAISFLASMIARSADDTTEAREELGLWLDRSGRGRAALDNVVVTHRYSGVINAPDFTLTNEEGEELALVDCRGKVLLLNFWGPGCPPCQTELPHIQKLNEQFEGRGVIFISVSSSEPGKRVTQVLAEAGVTYPTFCDRTIFEDYHVAGIPTTVIIDHVGRAMCRHVGFREGDETTMAEEIERLLAWIEDA